MTAHRASTGTGTEERRARRDCLVAGAVPVQASPVQASPVQARPYWQPTRPLSEYFAAGQRAASRDLTARPEAVKAARDFTRRTLGGWGLQDLADDAILVVSELVTNAMQHAAQELKAVIPDVRGRAAVRNGPAGRSGAAVRSVLGGRPVIKLRLLAQPPYLMCMVTDPSREIPLRRQASPAEDTGRGLQVIESCCSRWGWHLLDEGGKVVWALLPHGVAA